MASANHREHDPSQQMGRDPVRDDGNSKAGTHTNGSKALMETVGDDLEPSAADNLKSLVQECGVSPHKISELLQELPPLRSSDVLIDYYFSSMCVAIIACAYLRLIYDIPVIGPVIRFQNEIFERPTHQFVLMEEMASELPTPTMFAFYHCYSSCLPSLYVLLQNT